MADLAVKNAWIERVLGVRVGTGSGGPGQKAGVRLTQALILWNQTRSYVGQQVTALQRAILEASAEEEEYPDIVAGIDNLETVMSLMDDELLDVLSTIRATKDEGEKVKLLEQAHAIVKRCQGKAEGNGLLDDIDTKNGFMTLDIKQRITGTFTQVLELL
jgi:hypothetical protein